MFAAARGCCTPAGAGNLLESEWNLRGASLSLFLPLSLRLPRFPPLSLLPLLSPPVPPAAAAPPAQLGALGAIARLGRCGWNGRWLNVADEAPRAGPVGFPPRHPRGAVSPVRWAIPPPRLASLPAEPGAAAATCARVRWLRFEHPPLTPLTFPVCPWGGTVPHGRRSGAVSGMFGKNKRPLNDLLNPARRKGGTKGPPARRTKSFIHSLCTCPCLPRSSRAAFLVGWWWGESAGVVFSSFSPRTGPGPVPARPLRPGLRLPAALAAPKGGSAPMPALRGPEPVPGSRSGGKEPARRLFALRAGKTLRSRSPRPGFLRALCCRFPDVSSQGAVRVFGASRCLVSLPPV